jgi:hypothetical protein
VAKEIAVGGDAVRRVTVSGHEGQSA